MRRCKIVTADGPEALALYRHSTAHLLAAAVTKLFPGTQCGIGPATEDGFFYDFVVEKPFVPEDLEKIEAKMRELAQQDLPYERQLWPREEALEFFAKRGEPLKVQLIEEKTAGQAEVSCYTIKDRDTFVDFCVGPHVPSTGKLKAFKLLTTSNAYWKGDARNQPMQRIYGTAFFKDEDLKQYLHQIEEAKRRDHRRVGKDVGLFMFHPWAPGRGVLARQGHDALQPARRVHARACCSRPATPRSRRRSSSTRALWETSGHWQHYRQNMFLVESENVEMGVKAMNCPGHMLVFGERGPQLSRPAAPIPRADAAPSQRGLGRAVGPDPRPPVLAGRRPLLRDRSRRSARKSSGCSNLVKRVYGDFGLSYEVKLATRPAEFLGEKATWDHAEAELRKGARGRRRRLRRQRRRRRLLRTQDRLRRHGRHRPEVAVRDHPARLPAARPDSA